MQHILPRFYVPVHLYVVKMVHFPKRVCVRFNSFLNFEITDVHSKIYLFKRKVAEMLPEATISSSGTVLFRVRGIKKKLTGVSY